MRRCRLCQNQKSKREFRRKVNKNGKPYYSTICKSCLGEKEPKPQKNLLAEVLKGYIEDLRAKYNEKPNKNLLFLIEENEKRLKKIK